MNISNGGSQISADRSPHRLRLVVKLLMVIAAAVVGELVGVAAAHLLWNGQLISLVNGDAVAIATFLSPIVLPAACLLCCIVHAHSKGRKARNVITASTAATSAAMLSCLLTLLLFEAWASV